MTDENSQLQDALSLLQHYHLEHTNDKITRFRWDADSPDIYIVSDPELKRKLREFTAPEFPRPEIKGHRSRKASRLQE